MVKEDTTFPDNLIRIGENKEDNDLIISEAKQNDIWFHLDGLPSCHIIIFNDKKNPVTKTMINYCAQLVKENTKYKDHKNIKINYCPIKNVRRTDEKGKVILKSKPETVTI